MDNVKQEQLADDGLPVALGDALRRARKARGADFSQQDASDEMEVTLAAVRKWETDKARPMKGLYREAVKAFLAGISRQFHAGTSRRP